MFLSKLIGRIRSHPASATIVAAVVVASLCTLIIPGVHNPEVIITFLLIIALGTAGILIDPKPYSLCQLFSLFCVIFMGVIPMGQYIMGYVCWDMPPFSRQAYLTTNTLIICCQLTFLACAYCRRSDKNHQQATAPARALSKSSYIWLCLISVAAAGVVVWYYRNIPMGLVLRIDELVFRRERSVIEILLVDNLVRSIPALAVAVCIMHRRPPVIAMCITITCALVAAMPTAIARNQLASLGLPIFILAFGMLRRNKMLSLVLIILIATVFPLLNLCRLLLYAPSMIFVGADFDAYQNLMLAIDINFITDGRQLLGTLLFFVPRSLWPTKPLGSGYELANLQSLSFKNISMPIFGEGYVNFGVLGAIAFTIITALIFRRLDSTYKEGTPGLCSLIYLILIGSCIFLLRGALMPALAALCAYILAAIIVYLPVRTFSRNPGSIPSRKEMTIL